MADKKRFVFVVAHTGPAVNAIAPVARLFREQGHSVVVYLQSGQSASESYLSRGKVQEVLGELDVYSRESFSLNDVRLGACDAVICAMSPVTGSNILNLEISALHAGKIAHLPVYGVSDFPGSQYNPVWRNYTRKLTTVFSPMPEPTAPCKCVVTGWGALEKWRGEDVQKLGHEARSILGIGSSDPVLYVSFSPEPESPLALEHLALVLRKNGIRGINVVVNRHGREKTVPIAGNGIRYYDALLLLSEMNNVIDHSPEFGGLSLSDDYSIAALFRPRQFLSYQQALALTMGNGLMLSFFGTDALVAPYLASQGVLSACWLDPVYGGAVLKREKQVEGFDFPEISQPTDDTMLVNCLNRPVAL